MKTTPFISFLWPLVLQPSLSSAYWRLACSVSQTARADPILNPGTVSGHVHKFAGGSNVNENSNFDSLQTSQCSTCQVQADKSAYWTPQLYYAHANGSFEEVPNEGMTVYYLGRGGNSTNTVPFPPGFQMISGDNQARSYDGSTLTYLNTRPVADRVSFHCIDAANDIPEQHYMFDTNCVNGMRAQLNFQSCWDGVNLYLDNNAHVDYLSGIDYGVCPPSHPISIPGLFFEVLYWTNYVDQSGGGQFTYSNGDTTGYGFHGDFMNGWDMDIQTGAVENCLYTDNGGVVDACSYLSSSNDVNFSRDCLEQHSIFDEPVSGMLDALPGCNPLTSGPASAPQLVCPLDSHTPNSSSSTSSSVANAGPVATSSVGDSFSSTATSTSSNSLISSSFSSSVDTNVSSSVSPSNNTLTLTSTAASSTTTTSNTMSTPSNSVVPTSTSTAVSTSTTMSTSSTLTNLNPTAALPSTFDSSSSQSMVIITVTTFEPATTLSTSSGVPPTTTDSAVAGVVTQTVGAAVPNVPGPISAVTVSPTNSAFSLPTSTSNFSGGGGGWLGGGRGYLAAIVPGLTARASPATSPTPSPITRSFRIRGREVYHVV